MRRIAAAIATLLVIGASAQVRAEQTSATPKRNLYQYTSCLIDSDGDGLADCYETNTHVYVSPTNTGTDPTVADTDDDGLLDGEEVNGTSGGLNLPAFGVNPLHKDILLEYDWMKDSDCATGMHSHKPTQAMVDRVADMFANAPVSNPDGTTGIHVFQDVLFGPSGSPNSASNYIPDADGWITGDIFTPGGEYQTYESNYFPANRHGYFHYVIFAHYYTRQQGSSGEASIGGHEMLITLGCGYASTTEVANTIAHELGHNLGLLHGGDESCNYKPNYNSIMNYRFQFTGVYTCAMQLTGDANFSRGTRRLLQESSLYEPDGVCLFGVGPGGPPPIDWNVNSTIDTFTYALRLRPATDSSCPGGAGMNVYYDLHDFNDWGNIHLSGVNHASTTLVDCAPVPL